MLPSPPQGQPSRPALRLFDTSNLPGQTSGDLSTGGLSPQMTLTEFFEQWFLPIVLEGEGRDAATIRSYRESMAWWQRITGDPPLLAIDEFTIASFKKGLREATFTRGKTGRKYPLSAFTISKHLRQVRTVLVRVGPTVNPERPGKRLIDEVPHLRVEKPYKGGPKRCFSPSQARRVVAATQQLPAARTVDKRSFRTRAWWRAFLLTLFYTGLRTGTVLTLRRSMLESRDGHTWIKAPADNKTGKPIDKFLHPVAERAIAALGHGDLIFAWPYSPRYLLRQHDRLQKLAGFTCEQWLSPHAWRRTHGTEMAKLGAMYGRKIAQRTLDHEDEATTSTFYVDIEAELIAQLADIDCSGDDPRQRVLF